MMWSEAIRLGAAVTGKAQGLMVTADGNFACAVGAGLIGCGFELVGVSGRLSIPYGTIIGTFVSPSAVVIEKLKRIPATCPICSDKGMITTGTHGTDLLDRTDGDLRSAIICLNDDHNWSRERIADWIVASGHDFEAIPEPVVTQSVPEAEQVPA